VDADGRAEANGHIEANGRVDPHGLAEANGRTEPNGRPEANGRVDANGRAEANGRVDANGRAEANGRVDANGRAEANGRVDANGRAEANGRVEPIGHAEARGRSDANGRADSDGRAGTPPRPASGWASVPTSGSPTVSGRGSTNAITPVAGGPGAHTSAADTPAAGTHILGAPGPAAADAPGRRSRDDDAASPVGRRSTSLDDADNARPRVGRRAAPDGGDHVDGQRRDTTPPGSPGRDDAGAVPRPGGNGDAPMRPGDVDETLIAFWDDKAIERFRHAWHEVRGDFVDDPVTALTRAHDLITEAVSELTESLLAERDQLDPLRTTATPDTESMRMAMRGYREFLERILAL
jgi:hypothetical protein